MIDTKTTRGYVGLRPAWDCFVHKWRPQNPPTDLSAFAWHIKGTDYD